MSEPTPEALQAERDAAWIAAHDDSDDVDDSDAQDYSLRELHDQDEEDNQ